MHERYRDEGILRIWSEPNKLATWEAVELAVLNVRADLKEITREERDAIAHCLGKAPIDIDLWKQLDAVLGHDFNAFVDERKQHIQPPELQRFFHDDGMTSYDTEEPAFALMLQHSVIRVREGLYGFLGALKEQARKHRFTLMMGETHGQWAELQTFGKQCLTWLAPMQINEEILNQAAERLQYSKLSGAVGGYGGLSPEVEEKVLKSLGLTPFYGATQIMPREFYAPLAGALTQIVMTCHKIALDIRLGARSDCPIYREPFGKKQKGSSAMPHKRNPITLEQMQGMSRLALGHLIGALMNIETWRERAIEQSSVERNIWPDLFHTVMNALKKMTRIIKGLEVYPDNMILQVQRSLGTYATPVAKTFLAREGAKLTPALTAEEAYRIVQLAAWNEFEPGLAALSVRDAVIKSTGNIDLKLLTPIPTDRASYLGIETRIQNGQLFALPNKLDADEATVLCWNEKLRLIFESDATKYEWRRLFFPSERLKHEAFLFKKIIGE